jgi:hypothetical protein
LKLSREIICSFGAVQHKKEQFSGQNVEFFNVEAGGTYLVIRGLAGVNVVQN